jgi:hypothetical protein
MPSPRPQSWDLAKFLKTGKIFVNEGVYVAERDFGMTGFWAMSF